MFIDCRPDEAKQIASKMLGRRLYTKQTGREGKPVNKLIMCEKLFTRREYYFACLYSCFQMIVKNHLFRFFLHLFSGFRTTF